MEQPIIWTIGHSTRSIEEFIDLLKGPEIELLADIRQFPGSKRYPHFNSDNLKQALNKEGIDYIHFKDLGGRRKPRPDSKNTNWRLAAFRGYADYMETEDFKAAMEQLMELAGEKRTVYMCSEAVWWSCHRSLVSDYLKVRGWKVLHILSSAKIDEHPYTKAARVRDGQLFYSDSLFG